jgi:hypothetical protein
MFCMHFFGKKPKSSDEAPQLNNNRTILSLLTNDCDVNPAIAYQLRWPKDFFKNVGRSRDRSFFVRCRRCGRPGSRIQTAREEWKVLFASSAAEAACMLSCCVTVRQWLPPTGTLPVAVFASPRDQLKSTIFEQCLKQKFLKAF